MAERELTPEEKVQADINAALKGISSQSAETPTLEGISIPADQNIQKPLSGLTQVKSESPETPKLAPETDIKGMTGAVIRGAAPTAAYTTIGAGLGLPGGLPGMALGASAGNILLPLGDLAIDTINSTLGKDFATIHGAVTAALDKLGTPKPDTAAEKIVEAITSGVSSGYGGAKAFGQVAESMPSILSARQEALKKGLEFLAEKPKTQAAIGGAAAGSAEASKEYLGAGPVGSTVAAILGGLTVPFAKGAVPLALKGLAPIAESIVPSLKETKLFKGYKEAEAAERLKKIVQEQLPKDTAKREEVISALQKGEEFAKEGVKMMPGELTEYGPFLAMQKVAEKTIPEVAERKAQNLKAISDKVDQTMQPIGAASPQDTEAYFKSVLDKIENETKNQIAQAEKNGEFESAELMKSAAVRAEEIKANAEKGLLTKQEAYNQTQQEYKNLYNKIKQTTEVTAKDDFSKGAYDAIVAQKNIERQHINNLYNAANIEVAPFYQENVIKSYDELVKLAGEKERRIPEKIQKIINEAIESKKSGKPVNVNSVISDIQEINKEIRAANMSPAKAGDIKYLQKFKEYLNKDLEAQEGVSENLKKANTAYRDYAKIYKEGASKDVFKPDSFISKTLDEYIGKSEASAKKEDIERLRKAIIGTGNVPEEAGKALEPDLSYGVADLPQQPYLMDKTKLPLSTEISPEGELSVQQKYPKTKKQEGIQNVVAWIVGRMSSEISETNASESINSWMTKKGNRILEVFPEAQPLIDDIKSQFKTIEDKKNAAEEAVNKSKTEKIISRGNAKLAEKEAQIESKKIQNIYKNDINKLKDELDYKLKSELNPANEFFGANIPNLIGKIMKEDVYAETNFRKLLDLAEQDSTGKAVEGLKSGLKMYFNELAKSQSKTLIDPGIPSAKLNISKLQAELDAMNKLMRDGSTSRNIAEMVLGKDSQELADMDRARQMLQMVSRETGLQGTSLEKLIGKTGDQLANDLFSIAGIGVGGLKGFVVFKSLDLIRKLQSRTRVDIGERMTRMLSDAMLDNKQFIQLTTPITQESFPMTQQLLKKYGIIARASDFGLKEDAEKESEVKTKTGFGFAKQDNENKGGFPKL